MELVAQSLKHEQYTLSRKLVMLVELKDLDAHKKKVERAYIK
jgi:hypothetical protein